MLHGKREKMDALKCDFIWYYAYEAFQKMLYRYSLLSRRVCTIEIQEYIVFAGE